MSAEQGHPQAQYNYGIMCAQGEGGPQDLNEARRYFKMSADQGHPKAQYNYGVLCERGEGGEQDLNEARRYYKMSADQGDPEAQYNYGIMCAQGEGGPQDLNEARRYFKMSADQGHPKAKYNYGVMCDRGEGGEQDLNEARRYYKMSADQGYPEAQCNYGVMCDRGEGGPQDLNEARRYFKMSADQGNPQAKYNYGVMCDRGEGGPQDPNEARRYFKMSAEQGHPQAMIFLNYLNSLENNKPETTQEDLEADMEITLGALLKEAIDSSDEDDLSSTALVEKGDILNICQENEIKNNNAPQINEEIIFHSKNRTNNDDDYEKELNQELLEYNAKNQEEISEFQAQKQRIKQKTASRALQTLTVKRKDYIETCTKPQLSREMCEQQKKTTVAFETLEFVKSIFGQGKINTFSNDDARKAFADLGCKVENKKGENSTSLSFDLGKERRMRLEYQELDDQAHQEEKTKYHNPHGHGDNNLYNALKPHLKRFLLSINKSPETLQVK